MMCLFFVLIQKKDVKLKPQAQHLNRNKIILLPVSFLNIADANKTKGNAISISSIKIKAA
jgi:hypothetical protein